MPGFEIIGKEEKLELNSIFKKGSVLFRHGFDAKRKGSFKVKKFENNFKNKFKSKYSLAVTSGTSALRVALATLDLKKDDEVITQVFTFVATVEAIVESRAKPIITEIDETLNMDPNDLLKKITKKTKAVIVVHMLGVPANLHKIKKICNQKNIYLIEDTAWGCGGKFKNKYLGTWGHMGTFSFDFAKNITTGEGGMILFKNKNDYKKAAAWHDHGHENNPKKPRWEDTRKSSGFNFRMNELQGAVGIAQLKKLNHIINKHRKNRDNIWKVISKNKGVSQRKILKGSFDTADALIIKLKDKNLAIKLRKELLRFKISTKILPEAYTWHFASTWTHIKELKKNYKNLSKCFQVSKEIIEKCVSIPIFINMNGKLIKNIDLAIKNTLILK
jgi:8-amino-3,8-dideoxy-alpha-D-manno-octulosonate transaminase